MKKINFTYLLFLLLLLYSCSTEPKIDGVIIGIPSDIQSFNPMYAFSVEEGNAAELLYLSLLQYEWNADQGEVEFKSMLAEKWRWEESGEVLYLKIRDDVFWSDSVKCSVDDIIYSFDLYSDADVESRALGFFEKFPCDESGHILIDATFEKISSTELRIQFNQGSNPDLFEIDHLILPKHAFENIPRSEISISDFNENPITNGAYNLANWDRDQSVILSKNSNSFLISEQSPQQIIFKVIPEYQIRLTQLLNGEIDLMEDIQTEDVRKIKESSAVNVIPIQGRDFDYIGWNNIDPHEYSEGETISPNFYFGSKNVRKALTHALDRTAVIDEYLKGFGQLSVGPVSPIFKRFFDKSLNAHEFDIEKAKNLLKEEDWIDTDNDGIIEKDGVDFAFTLHIPAGNPRRDFAASLFKNNLLAVGIDVTIEKNEFGTFINNLFTKQYDAWMAAWVVPIPINLNISWYSELNETPLNFPSYQNKKVDHLLDQLYELRDEELIKAYYDIQKIIHDEEPYSFLYWVDNLIAHNQRIKNIKITPLGAVKHCWNWSVN